MRAVNRTNTPKHRLIIVASSIQSELIAHLSRQAEIAHALRQFDKLESACEQLEQAHAPTASYYRGYLEQHNERPDLAAARARLEYALNYAPRYYQARALLVLGNVAHCQGDYKSELAFYGHALSDHTSDLFAVIEAQRALAIRAALEGDHNRAIVLLQKVIPLAARLPFLQAQLFNSLAVEYRAVGRLHEAVRLAELACRSPLVKVYTEWNETREEIAADLRDQEARAVIVAAAVAVEKSHGRAKAEKQQAIPRSRNRLPRPPLHEFNLSSLRSEDDDARSLVVIFIYPTRLIQSRRFALAPIRAPSSFLK